MFTAAYEFLGGCEKGKACSKGLYCSVKTNILCHCLFEECQQHAISKNTDGFEYREWGFGSGVCSRCTKDELANPQNISYPYGIYGRTGTCTFITILHGLKETEV